MKLLPYESLTLETRDPLPIVRDRLAACIEAPRWGWNLSRNRAPYQGTISDDGFKITRVIHYRNSVLPVIRGRFEPTRSGTVVRVTMGLNPFVIGFLCLWFSTWYGSAIPIAFLGGIPPAIAAVFLIVPLVILAAFWGSFWYEANRSRRDLTEIILGREIV